MLKFCQLGGNHSVKCCVQCFSKILMPVSNFGLNRLKLGKLRLDEWLQCYPEFRTPWLRFLNGLVLLFLFMDHITHRRSLPEESRFCHTGNLSREIDSVVIIVVILSFWLILAGNEGLVHPLIWNLKNFPSTSLLVWTFRFFSKNFHRGFRNTGFPHPRKRPKSAL